MVSYKPYIGVTGFTSRRDIQEALEVLETPATQDLLLMVGILASSKTLSGEANKWPKRYPDIRRIHELMVPHRQSLNLIHYATDNAATLDEQLTELITLAGPWLDGFQLNVCWPDPKHLRVCNNRRRLPRIVLQIGSRAMHEVGNDPEVLSERLKSYQGLITDVLIDGSGGRGIPLDVAKMNAYVETLNSAHEEWLQIGVAGGLTGDNIHEITHLITYYSVNVDAEGGLRDEQDDLSMIKVRKFLHAAIGCHHPTSGK